MTKPYKYTLADLRQSCRLLTSIEVAGTDSQSEQLVGRNASGEIVVRVKGKVSPNSVKQFRNLYQLAVSAGIIKPTIPTEQEPT